MYACVYVCVSVCVRARSCVCVCVCVCIQMAGIYIHICIYKFRARGQDICAASNKRASKHLRKVVEDALQKHPHRRLASAQLMLARLKQVELRAAAQDLPTAAGTLY